MQPGEPLIASEVSEKGVWGYRAPCLYVDGPQKFLTERRRAALFIPKKDRATNPPPENHDGESRLHLEEQSLLNQVRSDAAILHAKWVEVRTFSWVRPRPPVLQTTRRMLRRNALEAWAHMHKPGWL